MVKVSCVAAAAAASLSEYLFDEGGNEINFFTESLVVVVVVVVNSFETTKNTLVVCTVLLAFLLMFASYHLAQAGHKGHVHINVWRGPSKGYKKHKFAPWGFYAKLPADDEKKHYR